MIILDGKSLAERIRAKIKTEIIELKDTTNKSPGLATILVGDDPASQIYVRIKQKACEDVGINSKVIKLPNNITSDELTKIIHQLNEDESIHGILLQLPLPPHLNANNFMSIIDVNKDVDGFHPFNSGNLLIGSSTFIPCTPKGILSLLDEYKIKIKGRDIVIINHSNILGKPLALLLLNRDATVSVCHEFTNDLIKYTRNADIIVIGIGKPKFLKKEMIKENATIIDVGISRINGKIYGDVDFEDVKDKVNAITPVPGGVGPMTVASLLENTLLAFKRSIKD
ncbi:MAG: bifunctional methylenetetrahydrofolate dehydrogenase/methenyltetrahydrofolate cyclohydrolase FolD [Candidatus Helarchaeota archaeon]